MNKKIFSVTLILMIACLMTICGSVASFIQRSTDEERAQAACFTVCAAPTENVIANDCEYCYGFTVSNYNETAVSEVAFTYDVVVSMPQEGLYFLQGLKIILSCNGTEKDYALYDVEKSQYTFADVETFYASTRETHNCILQFVIENDSVEKTDVKGIEVYIIARQID